ncbi:MAG: hypothetical protein ACPG1A_01600 [Halioglobus sp.]
MADNDEQENAEQLTGGHELSREEARKKRAHFLALAEEQEKASRKPDDEDSDEPTVATMILPGD